MLKTALFAAAAAIATVATAAPALAKDVTVFYGDLDLSSAKDQGVFARRIRSAARKACDFRPQDGVPNQAAMECYHRAHVKAKAEMASVVEERRLGG
jgi:UrcA family protein